jgi:lysophospholipase L1-like esterase
MASEKTQGKKGKVRPILIRRHIPVWFYLTAALIPVLFFILLEIALRLFNYGYDNRQWIPAMEGKLYLNPEIARRYFYTVKRIPFSNGDIFDEVKKNNAFRVFVLGESSAAGYPFLPLGAFSHYLSDRLRLFYPSSKIEVINIGLTAVNSFTLRDLFPGILDQKPDLILIYTGHNEYYGALGIGSMESLGTSREMINLILYLNKYKTIELLRNAIQWGMKLFSGEERGTGTLMSRMAKDQFIEYKSETYEKGIAQFEENIKDMLQMAKEKNVPVILSTLVSNLRDQPPFISIKSDKFPGADKIYIQAKAELNLNNFKKADSLFRFAKDLDGLRFRAPEELNFVIRSLCKEFNLPLVDIDSAFASISPGYITGDNMMTDHLHPTLSGYLLMGKLFFEKMKQFDLLPASDNLNISDAEQDRIIKSNFDFTELDSVLADYKIKLLKNDWPFVSKEKQAADSKILNQKNIIDSLAVQILHDQVTWEEAHRKLAAYYLTKKNINSFLAEMDALIAQYPFVAEYYDYVTNVLIRVKNYEKAYDYLKAGYEIKPNAFKTKWLGTINLYKNNLDFAEIYLRESLKFDDTDSQVWYNLAGVYVRRNNYKTALDNVNKALSLKSNYPEAAALQKQLQNAVNKRL